MTFVALSNLALSLLCVAVIVQTVRMIRRFNALKKGDLGDTVKSLDRATAQARQVLAELKEMLATDGAASVRAIQSGEELREELSVMIGIGNAVAERILEASGAERAREDEAPKRKPVGMAARARRAGGARGARSIIEEGDDEEAFAPSAGLMQGLEALASAPDAALVSTEKH